MCLYLSSRSTASLIEPVQEEDESSLMEAIDELAIKRDSSPAPDSLRETIEAFRKRYSHNIDAL